MTNPKKNGDLMLRVRYDSGAELAGPAVITDEGALLVSLGGAASMLVQRADGSLPPHITFVDIRPSHVGYGLPLTDDMAYMIDHERGEGKGLERIDDDDEENGSAADRPGRPEEKRWPFPSPSSSPEFQGMGTAPIPLAFFSKEKDND